MCIVSHYIGSELVVDSWACRLYKAGSVTFSLAIFAMCIAFHVFWPCRVVEKNINFSSKISRILFSSFVFNRD